MPLLLAVRDASALRAASLGALWGLLAAYATGDAMPAAMAAYFQRPPIAGWGIFLAIALASSIPFYAAFALAYRALAAGFALPWRVLLGAAAWTAVELGRGRLFTGTTISVGNPWALLGYSQVGFDALLQIASLVGIYGVGFVLAAPNVALAEWIAARRSGDEVGLAHRALGIALLPGIAALVFGALVLARAPAVDATRGHHRVGMAQANLGSVWDSPFYGRDLDVYLRLSLQAVDAGPPELLLWPEAAFTFLLEEEPAYGAALARLTTAADLDLLAGGPGVDPGTPRRYFNSLFAIDATGAVRGRYDKRYLLPISEFFPLERFDWLRERFERVNAYSHGSRDAPLPTRLGPAGVLICNEGMLPEVAAQRVRDGARFLVNPSNDSWLGRERWGEMMFDLISVRAIEQRRYLVRASTSGPSGIVDPWGRVRVRTEPLSRATALGWIEPRQGRTPYARVGDAFAFSCAAATIGAWVWTRRGARRPR